MNLFLQTRKLTKMREDHLTCFLAAALEADARLAAAYADILLKPIGVVAGSVGVRTVKVQVSEDQGRPDMELEFSNGLCVLCEHKIDAGETIKTDADGNVHGQLDRYLRIDRADYVAYFRSSLARPPHSVMEHEKYLAPTRGLFLWEDIYPALAGSETQLAKWLKEGFDELGFGPAAPHVGRLWPNDDEEVIGNQRNFKKLWYTALDRLAGSYSLEKYGRHGSEIYLKPKSVDEIESVHVSAIAFKGRILRVRVRPTREAADVVGDRLAQLARSRGWRFSSRLLKNGFVVDVLRPLADVIGDNSDVDLQREGLAKQVATVLGSIY